MNFDKDLADFGCGLDEEDSMSKNAAAFLKSYARTCTVFNAVAEVEDRERKCDIIRDYLDFCYDLNDGKIRGAKNVVTISVNGSGFESITSKRVPDLRKNSVSTLHLIEFFTHCCINCIHSIEDVRQVHEEVDGLYQRNSSNGFAGLKVLSIHSPKFTRERDTESIKAFCKRMQMEHSDVVNDPTCVLWNELGVTCWPTLLILGPNPEGSGPNLLFTFMGEDHKDELRLTLSTAVEYFQKKLVLDPSTLNGTGGVGETVVDSSEGNTSVSEVAKLLRFPGKVAVFNEQVAVSDSGNNRIVLARPTGHVIDIIGGTAKGNKDGSFAEARFYNPQGIAFESDSVFYVADTGNHSIRKVDVKAKQVSTLVPAGRTIQLNDESVVMKSPWDLCFYGTSSLIIAAAGNHRLFGYFFTDTTLLGADRKEATLSVIAGSGREENRNNSYIMKASFAQPSGITTFAINDNEQCIFIADSESSSIRSVTSKSQVVGVVGGSRDPTDLFAFGDVDGKGINVKLQHPMGICPGTSPAEIFIADTYNHKIKRIDHVTKECKTFVSEGLNEPSGICKDSVRDLLYVADTNNHTLKVIELKSGAIHEFEFITETQTATLGNTPSPDKYDKLFEVTTSKEDKPFKLVLSFSPLPDGFEGGQWKIVNNNKAFSFSVEKGTIERKNDEDRGQLSFSLQTSTTLGSEFYIVADIFFCASNMCLKRTRKIKVVCVSNTSEADKETETDRILVWNDMKWDN